jgi:hypothetical protein
MVQAIREFESHRFRQNSMAGAPVWAQPKPIEFGELRGEHLTASAGFLETTLPGSFFIAAR